MTQRDEYLKVCLKSEVIRRYLTCYARVIARATGVEEDDARQDLLLHLVRTSRYFNPAKADANAFAWVCLHSAKSGIIRRLKRPRVPTAEYTDGGIGVDPTSAWDESLYLRECLKGLPAKLNACAVMLAMGYKTVECARRMEVSRRTATRMKSQIAAALA